ncbi:MAG: asparaginase, partial [Candidatus Methanomethylophilaceae archaeon]|nr:asparaginase [Candidatus Methanomethylophilaceae archaeon]
DSFAVHNGARVRKMHTSRRDAFKSINATPVAHVDAAGKIQYLAPCRDVTDDKAVAQVDMEKDVVLLQFFPGMDPAVFEPVIMGSKGVVIAGSGLGHINSPMIPLVKKATDAGIPVVMTSQCLNGRVNMNVYNTGRDLINAGAICVYDMLPETAYVKLKWVLGKTNDPAEVREIMVTPLVGEMSDRREF